VAGLALVVLIQRASLARAAEPVVPAVPLVVPPAMPIGAEAQVFRTTAAMLALEPGAHRERSAHPRRLATVHFLRAYPGAPPRIPHPLTADEFRTGACKTCHERGGYSVRFAAYVPLTPHPERGLCLQCHVGIDSVIGAAVPDPNPSARCPQCHAPDGRPKADMSATWPTTVWPTLARLIPDQDPPPIPHDLPYRENCLTCHAGPAAVEEIRTSHPERADCRQCHVARPAEVESFAHAARDSADPAGGAR
jgi:cytochrome c-type protein NapB